MRLWILIAFVGLGLTTSLGGQELLPPPRNVPLPREALDLPRVLAGNEPIPTGEALVLQKKKSPEKIQGVHVWTDTINQLLYIRIQPGSAPVAIPLRDLQALERIKLNQPLRAEIHTLVITNGTIRNETYYASDLSPAERERLAHLQRAENELTERETHESNLAASVRDQTTPNPEPIWGNYWGASPGSVLNYPNLIYYYQLPSFSFSYSPTLYFPGFPGYGGLSPSFQPWCPNPSSTQGANVNLGDLVKSLALAQEQATRARQTLATVRAQFVLDSLGQVLAVRPENK